MSLIKGYKPHDNQRLIHAAINQGKEKSIVRSTYYEWLQSDDQIKSNTIKKIDELFKSLAADIVANEGKGIFYAKNRLGMHDRQHLETRSVDKFDFE